MRPAARVSSGGGSALHRKREGGESSYDGFVCLGRGCEQYGFILFRYPVTGESEFVASRFSWPPTDEGRAQAELHMRRLIDRERLSEHWPNASAYDVVFEGLGGG